MILRNEQIKMNKNWASYMKQFCFLYVFLTGTYITLLYTVAIANAGVEHITIATGMMATTSGLACVVMPPLAGRCDTFYLAQLPFKWIRNIYIFPNTYFSKLQLHFAQGVSYTDVLNFVY